MARNIEIKAKVSNFKEVELAVINIADGPPCIFDQDDAFFAAPNGRLKLRQLSEVSGKLIFYIRPNQEGPKESYFKISETNDPNSLRDVLSEAYGCEGRVIKRRKIYTVGRTRIHLDQVVGLGDFIELEVELVAEETVESGLDEIQQIMCKLAVSNEQLIDGAYHDLLRSVM